MMQTHYLGMLEVRMAKENEKLTTLDEVERTLSTEDIVISDGKKAIGLAGVMGGLDTEITPKTKNIIIEAAIFDGVKIRKTSKSILRSEASLRFEKGLDPNRTYMAIERSCNLLSKYAGATIVGGLVKEDLTNKEDTVIYITVNDITKLLGIEIPKMDIKKCFERLGFKAELSKEDGITFKVSVPKRRLDISIKEDLVEEVGRIYGVNNIVGKLPVLPIRPGSYDIKTRNLRNKLVSLGLNETLSYILVNDKEAKRFTKDTNEAIPLLDPMTEDRNTLRSSLATSLYKIYEYNKAHFNKDVSIFEIGKSFYKNGEDYVEEKKLSVLMLGEFLNGIDNQKQVDFYCIKGIAEEVLDYLGYSSRYSFVVNDSIPDTFHPGKSAAINVNNDIVGFIGRVHPTMCKDEVYVMEINLTKLLDKKVGKMKYKELSKYPSVKKDLAVVVDKNVTSGEIEALIKKLAGSLLLGTKIFDLYEGENLGTNKKSIAYSLELGANDRTLTDEEINNVLDKIISGLEKQGCIIRK